MANVQKLPDPLESVALEDPSGGSRVVLAPGRGGLVTRFSIGERQVLYLEEATLRDPDKNVRGGVPVLFPTPGKLVDDRWAHAGQSGSLRQHGFARNLSWEASDSNDCVKLSLASGEATRDLWPWSFVLEHRFSLSGRTLRIDQRIENRSDTAMPCGLGFHPYFQLPSSEKAGASIDTRARRAWDNVSKRETLIDRIELGAGEVDLHLLDHDRNDCALLAADGTALVCVEGSAEYTRWVIWTLPGKDFVCLEPWTSPGNALNDGEGLLSLAPGEARELFVAITA